MSSLTSIFRTRRSNILSVAPSTWLHIIYFYVVQFDCHTQEVMIEIFHLIKIDLKIPLINNELKFISAAMGMANLLKSF